MCQIFCIIIHNSQDMQSFYQGMNGLRKCDTFNGILPSHKKNKSCHLWQQKWDWRSLPLSKISQAQRDSAA
jgi:hypothetical protein